MGQTLLMGRRTFESIGQPLPGRQTIILSRDPDYNVSGCDVATTIAAALQLAKSAEELFICGGAEIYQQTLVMAERIYLTELDIAPDGDAFFPEIADGVFRSIYTKQISATLDYRFTILQRSQSLQVLSSDTQHKL